MSAPGRNTTLGWLLLDNVSGSSVVQFGDGGNVTLTSRALAVQRAVPNEIEDPFRFASYTVFYRPAITMQGCFDVDFQSESCGNGIRIDSLQAFGVAASSHLRVGCGGPLQAAARIKHIRQFNNRDIR